MMMMEKEDLLGLSLSLTSSSSSSSSTSVSPHQLTLMPSSSHASPLIQSFPFSCPQKPLWCTDLLLAHSDKKRPSMNACRGMEEAVRPLLRGIDVNQTPSYAMAPPAERENEEDATGASSPNSTVSSAAGAGKSGERGQWIIAGAGDENDAERASSRGPASDEEDGEGARKKLRLSKDQSAVLEESFKEHNTLNPKQKLALAKQLNLRPRQVEVWFQNRRARTKLKQTEVDCEFLKRCCDNLTEENRRLQKEVQELRALKLSPQLYMHMTPPTTLTMCPSCERVSNSGTMTAAAGTTCTASKSSSPAPEQHQFLLHHLPVNAPWAPPIPLHPQRS